MSGDKKSAILDRYSEQQAAFWIDGYFNPQPNETDESAFDRAKAELISHLENHIDQVREFGVDTFLYLKRKGI